MNQTQKILVRVIAICINNCKLANSNEKLVMYGDLAQPNDLIHKLISSKNWEVDRIDKYTGVDDNNGNKIYENDNIKRADDHNDVNILTVTYKLGVYGIVFPNNKFLPISFKISDGSLVEDRFEKKIVVYNQLPSSIIIDQDGKITKNDGKTKLKINIPKFKILNKEKVYDDNTI